MLTVTGCPPRPVSTLAGAWTEVDPPPFPRFFFFFFTNVTANQVSSPLAPGHEAGPGGDRRPGGERHSKTSPVLPQGRNWQVTREARTSIL